LQEFCLFACTRTSYDTVATLVSRMTGEALVCPQTLCHWVQQKACQLDAALATEVAAIACLPMPTLAEAVDLYDGQVEEVLLLCDGICVKAQKPTHERVGEPRQEKPCKRHDTDVMLLQGKDGRFRYLMGSTDGKHSLPAVAGVHLRQEWQGHGGPLPLVAITDGAQKIRQDLWAMLGRDVPLILDWYHLAKRVHEHLSMIAHGRAERKTLARRLLGFLWQGQTQAALEVLSGVSARNGKALTELVGYLHKHAGEIIDYGRRRQSGKPIGSGRMEKAVDQVVGMRQKKKGMSWSRLGSQALAALKIAQLNGQWQDLWTQQNLWAQATTA
jgi:hypothetical protein